MDSNKPWVFEPRDSAALFDELFVQIPAAEAWQARAAQPLSALTRPAEPADARVPLVEMGTLDDLDAIARGLAADVDRHAGRGQRR